MNSSGFPQYRGMQVHAVPDSDKAFDSSTGKKLPWAYDLNPNASTTQRDPVEKGPFGRGTNRRTRSTLSRSRSKTAEPKREEDRIRAEQLAAEDAVFGGLPRTRDTGTASAEGDGQKTGTQAGGLPRVEDGSEVILYGFGSELQWAAIDFFERVSEGRILEDYARQMPEYQRPDRLTMNVGNTPPPKKYGTWSRLALKKKNTYAGGLHWIKVTFDTQNAAELACARSPHVIKGYLVYAEPYEQRGPGRDEAIPATQAGAQITDDRVPTSFSTQEKRPFDTSPGGSSTTATSATATAPRGQRGSQTSSTNTLDDIFAPQRFARQQQQQQQAAPPHTPTSPHPTDLQPLAPAGTETLRRRRIADAKSFTVHPASMALAPKKTKQSWSSWLLGTGDVIGSTVPKREDGAFDWERAGFYWRVFYWLDGVFGTDFCGLKAD